MSEKAKQKNPFPTDQFQHYYLHDGGGQPLAVVAIGVGTEPGKIVRGISIRSALDNWDKVKGRKKAVGRIRKALAIKVCSDPIGTTRKTVPLAIQEFMDLYGKDFHVVTAEIGYNAVVKSGYNVPPTERETKILAMLVKRLATPATPAAEVAATPVT